jgi:colicin import membrane protein
MTDNEEFNSDEESYRPPEYKPEHILSPEFNGTSNYEMGVGNLVKEKQEQLESLKKNPKTPSWQIKKAEDELKKLERLYENYNTGMNVFRTAKGGRDKIID